MSKQISEILEVLDIVVSQYKQGMSLPKINELRRKADDDVAQHRSIGPTSVSDTYRRRLRPEITGTWEFAQLLHAWLDSGDAKLQSILEKKADSYEKRKIRDFFSGKGIAVQDADMHQRIMDDVKEVADNIDLTETSRKALIDARKGQGEFRSKVLSNWDGGCAVTECRLPELLRASHIKPWRDATNDERLDPENGFMLIANLDALFDVGLISFGDDGNMLISERLSTEIRELLQIPKKLSHQPSGKQLVYLAYHRNRVLKGWQ